MNRPLRRRHDGDEHDRYFKRRRTAHNQNVRKRDVEEDPIKTVIFDLAVKTKHIPEHGGPSLETNIEGVSKILETELASQKPKILQLLTEAVTNFPDKCTIYSTLVGLLNAKNYGLGGEFVESIVRLLREQLKSSNWDEALKTFRFISDLVNSHVISANSLLQLYDTFMEAALDSGINGGPQVRRDWHVFCILASLPWVGRELYDKKEQTVERLLMTIDSFMKRRRKTHAKLLRVWSSDDPHPQEEYLDCLWAQIEKLKLDGWVVNHIQRPYISFDSVLCEALQHNLPAICLPAHYPNMRYATPQVVFRLFDYTDCPDGAMNPVLPGSHSIERFLMEEEIRDILKKYHKERKECSAELLDYPHGEIVPVEYMITEVIFGELFRLPTSTYLEVCYSSILIELCKRQPGVVPRILAQTTELLFSRLDSMSVSCFDRFVNWFAYHLSNFQFRWSWEDWSVVLEYPDMETPKPRFVQEVLLKCIRLSYYERLSEMVPKIFEKLMPPPMVPTVKYDPEKDTTPVVVRQLATAIRSKAAPEDILVIVREIPAHLSDGNDDGSTIGNQSSLSGHLYSYTAIEIFTQTLLLLGSKSLSHAHAAIAKYQHLFKTMAPSDESQISIIRAGNDMWKADTQMMTVIVDFLLKYQIVSCAAVANWIFSEQNKADFSKMYLWEILHLAIRKMNKHVDKLSNELNDARDKLQKAEMQSGSSESSESSEEDEDGNKKPKESKKSEKAAIPTEEQVDKMEEKLELAQADQKNLFLIVFQRFIMILSEHIAKCDTDGKNFANSWYRWTIGRLQQVFMQHSDQVAQYSSTLETLLFTSDLDRNILEIFQQFQSLRS